jgi:hypothetical protein
MADIMTMTGLSAEQLKAILEKSDAPEAKEALKTVNELAEKEALKAERKTVAEKIKAVVSTFVEKNLLPVPVPDNVDLLNIQWGWDMEHSRFNPSERGIYVSFVTDKVSDDFANLIARIDSAENDGEMIVEDFPDFAKSVIGEDTYNAILAQSLYPEYEKVIKEKITSTESFSKGITFSDDEACITVTFNSKRISPDKTPKWTADVAMGKSPAKRGKGTSVTHSTSGSRKGKIQINGYNSLREYAEDSFYGDDAKVVKDDKLTELVNKYGWSGGHWNVPQRVKQIEKGLPEDQRLYTIYKENEANKG